MELVRCYVMSFDTRIPQIEDTFGCPENSCSVRSAVHCPEATDLGLYESKVIGKQASQAGRQAVM